MTRKKDFIGYVWYKYPVDEGGEKVGVNWYRKNEMGISFLNSDGHKVVNESEVEFRYGAIEMQEEKDDVRKESYQELKERLERIRRERNQYGKRRTSKTKKKKSTSKQTPEDKKKAALKKLMDADPNLLKEILQDS